MTLDPAATGLLDQIAAAGGPPLETMTPAEARETSGLLFEAFAGPLVDVHEVRDVDAGGVPARLYDPTGAPDTPLVVELHGGGWVLGGLDDGDNWCRSLAVASGARVLAVDYRLAPEHPFPAGLDDAVTAAQWAAGLGAPVAVLGESAGGNLAAALCLLARDRGGPPLAAQVLVYPVLDARCDSGSYREFGEGHLLTAASMRWFAAHYLSGDERDPTNPLVSPLLAPDLSGLPPTLVITAECDPLRDEGEVYAARLREAGVDAVTSRYDGMIHGYAALPALFPIPVAATIEQCGWTLKSAFAGATRP